MSINDQYLKEVSESIKSLFDLTSRVDERVHLMIKKQESMEHKQSQHAEILNSMIISTKLLENQYKLVAILEEKLHKYIFNVTKDYNTNKDEVSELKNRIEYFEKSLNTQENRWKTIFDMSMKVVWTIVVAYLLLKLKLNSPIGLP